QSILYTTVQDLSGPPPIDPSGFQVGTNHPAFEVRFRRDLTHERADVPSSARAGIDVREPYLLQGLDVILHDPNRPPSTVRKYNYKYTTGEFGKTLLQAVPVSDPGSGGDEEFYRHTFSYKSLPRDASGQISFGPAKLWGDLGDQVLSRDSSDGKF